MEGSLVGWLVGRSVDRIGCRVARGLSISFLSARIPRDDLRVVSRVSSREPCVAIEGGHGGSRRNKRGGTGRGVGALLNCIYRE